MNTTYRLGFIGLGKMGRALWEGVCSTGIKASYVEHPDFEPDGLSGDIIRLDLEACISQSDIVFLCVKPQQMASVLSSIATISGFEKKYYISIAAGVSLSTYESVLGSFSMVCRVMPNTPVLVKEGMIALSFNDVVSNEFRQFSLDFFDSLGRTLVCDELCLDAVTDSVKKEKMLLIL